MTVSNSPLVNYTAISPNKSVRTQRITKITPHYMAGNLSVETCGNVFAPTSRQASSNYGIGSDGRVGMYVPENYRAWTSSSSWNDQRAVTIEVANIDSYGTFTNAAWATLVNLCVDICQRNGIPELVFTGDSSGSLTWHCMYSSTSCPGQFMKDNTLRLCNEVNAILRGDDIVTPEDKNDIAQMAADRVVNYMLNGVLLRDRIIGTDGAANAALNQLTRVDDPTGRNVNANLYDHVKWMAAKQAAMDEKLDEITKLLEDK